MESQPFPPLPGTSDFDTMGDTNSGSKMDDNQPAVSGAVGDCDRGEGVATTKRRFGGKDLDNTMLNAIGAELFKHFDGVTRKLKYGALKLVGGGLNVPYNTMKKLWVRAKTNFPTEGEILFIDLSHNRKKRSGRKAILASDDARARIKALPVKNRQTLKCISSQTGMTMHQVRKLLKEEHLKKITSSLKPLLTQENRDARFLFCSSFIEPQIKMFYDMYDHIHIDEKLFNLKKVKCNYYLVHGEDAPLRVAKSKRHIPKVMFLCAVARPRWDPHRNQHFDGKLGIWPFVITEEAKRASRNRPKGTLETKVIMVNQPTYREMLINKLLPAILQKWPTSFRDQTIKIQQDNARPHISVDDPQWLNAVAATQMDIKLVRQPPNSPDMNVLDLGLFAAIQAAQYKKDSDSIDAVITAVKDSF